MYKSFILVIASAAILCGFPALGYGAKVDLCDGEVFLADLENQKALRAFQRCLGKAASLQDRAVIHLYLGIAQFSLLRKPEAEEEFRTALTLDPGVQFPPLISPKIKELFIKVRQEHGPALAPSPIDAPAPLTPAGHTPPEPEADPPAPREQTRWAAWITAGVGLAAALTATGLYIGSDVHQGQINDLSLSYQEGSDHHDTASTLALSGNIVMGVAAASAALAVYFFLTEGEPAAQEKAVIPRAARLTLGGIRW